MDFLESQNLGLFVRLAVASLCGALIGLEREYRAKEAGLRTHFLVALGSALFMVISQYGFTESIVQIIGAHPGVDVRADVSRVASQVVTGIGFIGAGAIMVNRGSVVGLTTAAGLWVVAAIGMAAGCGLIVLALSCTLLALVGLEIFLKVDRVVRRHNVTHVHPTADEPPQHDE